MRSRVRALRLVRVRSLFPLAMTGTPPTVQLGSVGWVL